jgi:hypothetical protein
LRELHDMCMVVRKQKKKKSLIGLTSKESDEIGMKWGVFGGKMKARRCFWYMNGEKMGCFK